jgi:diguanylate cyclase (GGDEF)-like protein
LSEKQQDAAWDEICYEVDRILEPTLRLAGQVAEASEQIRRQSNHFMNFLAARVDMLTSVSNRAGLDHFLTIQFAEMQRYDAGFSLLLFDIDDFKQVNDRHGHQQGDRVLREVAKLLDASGRQVDFLARYGGDEFVMVMPQTDLAGAGVAGERLRASVAQNSCVTASVGAAVAVDGDTPESLIARADAALYKAKFAGRNRVFSNNCETIEPLAKDNKPVATVAPIAVIGAETTSQHQRTC